MWGNLTGSGASSQANGSGWGVSQTQMTSSHAKRSELAQLTTTGRDPLRILAEQNELRLPGLVPLRAQRMSVSPFTFYRGTAALMAADLARDPSSGILIASCGDAHVSNFGFYASPQRTLVFDLNDFDESAWAPWEWDLKRLVASVIISGQATNRSRKKTRKAARAAIDSYLGTLREAIKRSPIDRYFASFNPSQRAHGLDKQSRVVLDAAISDASKRTGVRAARKLTRVDDEGRARFIEQPPTTTPIDDATAARITEDLRRYQKSAAVDIRLLLRQYSLSDMALRVVGVGSVGTRCYLALFDDGKGGKLILQAVSDPFLGHLRQDYRDYYVRQFHDMKGGIDTETLGDKPFRRYAAACGAVLARAHAQSPAAADIVEYVGGGKKLTRAILA